MAYRIESIDCNCCLACLEACPMKAIHTHADGRPQINPDLCTDCGSCADICPQDAVRGG